MQVSYPLLSYALCTNMGIEECDLFIGKDYSHRIRSYIGMQKVIHFK